jgi:hypothetical protein
MRLVWVAAGVVTGASFSRPYLAVKYQILNALILLQLDKSKGTINTLFRIVSYIYCQP